ncbi:hypothetical protein BV20DRAFT_1052165 [Pilatotrama ljubarskyi]|nr:hypothetical protein BV20DRAFT_1052165 [Pilatotrama ljubarskyi]
MSTSQRASRSPGGAAASQGEFESTNAGAPYKPPGPPLANLPTSGVSRPRTSASSSSMIGQIPSLYDPNMAIPPEGLDYQQWVENYQNGQYPYAQAGLSGNVSQVPFQPPQQQPQQPQSQLHHVQAPASAAAPTQNRYNFVQEAYATGDQGTSYDPHFVQPVQASRPQRGLPRISRRSGATVGYPVAPNLRIPDPPRGPYQQTQQSPHPQQQAFAVQGAAQGNDSYFYGSVNPDVMSGSGDQPHHHSSYNFVQQYQPESYSATSYTPNSDFTNLPSSVSTPSVGGTDDNPYSSASSHAPQPKSTQQAQASSSRMPSGTATRGRGRGGKQAVKRQRVEDPQDGGDSDTSDDEQGPTMTGLNMTVSVPPPQGQNSLPARL